MKSIRRPRTRKTGEKVEHIGKVIREDRRLTIQVLSDKSGIGYGVCQDISTENLNTLQNIAPKFVPRLLTNEPEIQQCLAHNNMVFMLHPPYSSDLATCDFGLFPNLRMKLKGLNFVLCPIFNENRRRCLTALEIMNSGALSKV